MNQKLLVTALVVLYAWVALQGAPVAHTAPAPALLEVSGPFVDSGSWGRHIDTAVETIAAAYVPLVNQTVCGVGQRIARMDTLGSADLGVYRGGPPDGGILLATSSILASDLPADTGNYTTFPIVPCLVLEAGDSYWFVWTSSAPRNIGFVSAYRPQNEFQNTSYWQLQPFTFQQVGWTEYPNREWSLRLEGPVGPFFGELDQLVSDGSTSLAENATTSETALSFRAVVTGSPGIRVRLEVEAREVLVNIPNATSSYVEPGMVATTSLTNFPDGDYVWQARAVDEEGNASVWAGFGSPALIDFHVRREPVIIIPGIMGTRLNRASDGEEVWPNTEKMTKPFNNGDAYLNELALDTNGNEVSSSNMDPVRLVEEELHHTVYKNLLEKFKTSGYTIGRSLFEAPYDWRLDLSTQTERLSQIIQGAINNSPTGKVNIVAHSMGGLLVKQYLAGLPDTSFVHKFVLAGSPQIGAPKAFKALNYGDNMGFEFGPIDILNPERVKIIAQNMPGVYELLPSRRYVEANGGYVKDFRGTTTRTLDYNATNQFMVADPADSRNSFILGVADAFHTALDTNPVNTPRAYNIVGCQDPNTIGEFRIYDNGKIDIVATNGDGTVPLTSAMNLSGGYAGTYFIRSDLTGIDHMGLVRDERSVELMKDIITGEPITLPSGFSTLSSSCFNLPLGGELQGETTIAVSTHSPVALHAYDSENRHTGPLPNGDIELGIPGSRYEKLGENSFVFLPAHGTYRFVADSLAQGSFDMKARAYHGSDVAETTTYLNVPLASASTSAMLTVLDGAPTTLELDSDGNGTSDRVIAPTAILSATSSIDAVPPEVTIISPSSTAYLHSTVLPILVQATDTESGIAYLETRLDGTLTTSTVLDLFYQHLGGHTLSVRAVDNIGNPRERTVEFRVIATVESAITDVERVQSLGWITKPNGARDLIRSLKTAVRIERRIELLKEKLSGGSVVERRIERLERRLDKVLGRLLLKDLETYRKKGFINEIGYNLIKEDIEWLINN